MSILSSAIKVAGGVVGAQFITALALPALTRLYSPEAFSLFAYYFSIASILSSICYLRLEVSISRYSEEDCRDLVFPALSKLLKITAPFLLLIAFVAQEVFRPPSPDQSSISGAFLICIAAVSFANFNAHAIFLSKKKYYSRMAFSRLLRSAVSVVSQLLLAFFGKVIFLFVGEVIGRSVGALSIKKLSKNKRTEKSAGLLKFIGSNIELVKYGLPAVLLNSAALNLYPIALAANYPSKLVGIYFLVHKMVATPITLVAQSISTAVLGDVGKYLPSNKDGLRAEMLKVFLLILPLGLCFFFLLWLILDKFSSVLFGQGWEGAGEMVFLLIPLLTMQVSTTPFSQLLNVLGRSGTQLIWDSLRLVVVILSIAIPKLLSTSVESDFHLTVMLYSVSSAVLYLIHFFLIRNALSVE